MLIMLLMLMLLIMLLLMLLIVVVNCQFLLFRVIIQPARRRSHGQGVPGQVLVGEADLLVVGEVAKELRRERLPEPAAAAVLPRAACRGELGI